MIWKMPPTIKVLEALGAIADGRVEVKENTATVKSSNLNKRYIVRFYPEKNKIYSTDNASKFHNYIGYPIISFLMLKGMLDYSEGIASALKGIKWKDLNDKFKRNYSLTEKYALKKCEFKSIPPNEVKKFINITIKKLKNLNLQYGKR